MAEEKGWTFVKIAGFLGELIERSRAILGALFGLGAIGGTLAYYYSLFAQYLPYILALLALLILFSAIAITWAVADVLAKRRDDTIAAEFLRLENVYLPFEREAVRLFYQVALNSSGTVDVTNLENCLADYLEAICNTAASVFGAKKRRKKPITANIKRIEESDDPRSPPFVYRPLVRSSKYDQHRLEYDQELEDNPSQSSQIMFTEGYLIRTMRRTISITTT
jgi:hypothetical protein